MACKKCGYSFLGSDAKNAVQVTLTNTTRSGYGPTEVAENTRVVRDVKLNSVFCNQCAVKVTNKIINLCTELLT